MEKQTRKEKRIIRDPSQRTVVGGISHVIWKFIQAIAAVLVTVLLIGAVAGVIVAKKAEDYINNDIKPNANYSLEGQKLNESSFIYVLNQTTGEYEQTRQLYATENRVWAEYDEFPEDMIHAVVAIEDKRFYTHNGVDWKRTLSACANMFMGGSSYGGSTITQQLIKNLTKKDEVTVRRKLLEIFTALNFETHYSKEEILMWYLNTVYFNEGAYGAKSAAKTYFGKELSELTTKECASIIGITNNPSKYDPYIYPENNEKRTLLILGQMREQGYLDDLTEEQYQALRDEKLVFGGEKEEELTYTCASCGYAGVLDSFTHDEENDAYLCPSCGVALTVEEEKPDYYTYFEDQIVRDVISDLMDQYGYTEEYASQLVTTGGFKIFSTMDTAAQAAVDSVYQDLDQIPKTYSSQQLQSAIVVIDNKTGDIVAMAGGVGEKTGSLTWNHATMSQRPTGSSIKPVTVYGPALEYGIITPGTAFEDSPYDTKTGWPQNDSRTFSGWMLVYDGLINSLNTISVKTCAALGVDRSFEFATQKMGMTSLVEYEVINGREYSDMALAPLALGQQTHGVTVREMAQAFATFPNKGVYRQARTYSKVVDGNGKVILDNEQEMHTAMSEHAAWYITYMLRNACIYGTGYSANMSTASVCGKTGTSNDNQDRWFSGYTPNYTASVWCGYAQPEEIHLVSGGNPSSALWKKVMTILHADIPYENYQAPTDEAFVPVTVCNQTGKLCGENCTEKTVYLFASDVPTETCEGHEAEELTICYPNGNEDKNSVKYMATDYCREYYDLISSPEFLAADTAALGGLSARFKPNVIDIHKIVMLKSSDGEDKLSEKDKEFKELDDCPVHTAALVAALREAIGKGTEPTSESTEPTTPPTEPPTETTVPPTEPTVPPTETTTTQTGANDNQEKKKTDPLGSDAWLQTDSDAVQKMREHRRSGVYKAMK